MRKLFVSISQIPWGQTLFLKNILDRLMQDATFHPIYIKKREERKIISFHFSFAIIP
jgi:hypothetical protein